MLKCSEMEEPHPFNNLKDPAASFSSSRVRPRVITCAAIHYAYAGNGSPFPSQLTLVSYISSVSYQLPHSPIA